MISEFYVSWRALGKLQVVVSQLWIAKSKTTCMSQTSNPKKTKEGAAGKSAKNAVERAVMMENGQARAMEP